MRPSSHWSERRRKQEERFWRKWRRRQALRYAAMFLITAAVVTALVWLIVLGSERISLSP